MPLYHARKKHLADLLAQNLLILENRVRFIREILTNKLSISNIKQVDLKDELHRRGYKSLIVSEKIYSEHISGRSENQDASTAENNYDYLLGMPVRNITSEMISYFENELAKTKDELDKLLATPPSHLWRRDLDQFVRLYGEV